MSDNATSKQSFTEVDLLDLQRKKAPKRLIHFSDGILEEFSSEDELDSKEEESGSIVDASSMKWMPYFGYMLWLFGLRTLAVCDYLGEHLAWFFGITSPKYQYELDLYEKITNEEKELQKHTEEENAGWILNSTEQQKNTVDFQPKSNVIVNPDMKLRKADVSNGIAISNQV